MVKIGKLTFDLDVLGVHGALGFNSESLELILDVSDGIIFLNSKLK